MIFVCIIAMTKGNELTLFDIVMDFSLEKNSETSKDERISETTIQYQARDYVYRNTGFVPKITISGKYLRDFGYEIGDKLIVKVSDNKIELVKQNNNH